MIGTDKVGGVLDRERRRQEFWRARGVPDPVEVEAEERTTRRLYGPADFRSPRRALLDAHFEQTPRDRPVWW